MNVSQKVLLPAVLGSLVGLVLVITGVFAKDSTLETVGVTVILSALGYGGVGYSVPHK